MAVRSDGFTEIDQNIAANVRATREAADISQEDLAQRMSDRGFGFSQSTIWKIETGQRPVRVSELVALADSLDVLSVMTLTDEPVIARHEAVLRRATRTALTTYDALKQAAAEYLEAQVGLVVLARSAHDDGLALNELHTSWLDVPAEQAVIEARMEMGQADVHAEQVTDAVGQILETLRSHGYEPAFRVEDVEVHEGGPLSPPAQPADG